MLIKQTLPAKILFIDRRFTPTGGAQYYLDQLVLDCLKVGYEVELAVNSHPNIDANYQLLRKQGVKVATPLGEQSSGKAAKRLEEFIIQSNPDLIHVNSSCREYRQVLGKIGGWSKMKCKRIFTMHGSILSGNEYLGRRCLPWSYEARNRAERKKFLDVFDRCISVSEENGKKVSEFFSLPTNRVVCVPNGVNVSKFFPRNDSALDRRFVIGCCARLSKPKSHDIVIRAVAKLASGNDICLRLAGDGSERERLEELVKELKITDCVEFLGTQRDVSSFFQSLDLFVITSDREGLPYALLEAMATGLPSIVTDVNEMPIVVRNGQDGFVIPTRNVNACYEKMRTLMDDASLRARFGKSARQRVCDEYSETTSLEKTQEVFASVISDQTEENARP